MSKQKYIRTVYPDGKIIYSNLRNNIGVPIIGENKNFEAEVVTEWYDGSVMNGYKADGKIYLRSINNGEFLRVILPNWGETFLEKDTMAQVRALTSTEVLLLKMGYYKGVKLNGYYSKGDTPAPIEYALSITTDSDDGGSVIAVGGIKLEHVFTNDINVAYYGIMADSSTVVNDKVNSLIAKASQLNKPLVFNDGIYLVDSSKNATNSDTPNNTNKKGILLRDNLEIRTSSGTIFKSTPNSVGNSTVICCHYANNVKINCLKIIGDKKTHTGTGGEWGHGLFIVGSKNVEIGRVEASECWGDGFVLSGDGEMSGGEAGTNNENIIINSIHCYDNRRNGVTISNVNGFFCNSIVSVDNSGIDPQSGVDFEPDYNTDVLKNIRIKSISTKNHPLYGLTFYLLKLSGSTDFVDIVIDSLESYNEIAYHNGGVFDSYIKGQISINKIVSYNATNMAFEKRSYFNAPDVFIGEITTYNSNSSNRTDKYGSAVMIYRESDDTQPITGKVHPNIIIDKIRTFNSNSNGVYSGVFIDNALDVKDVIKNVQIKDVFVQNFSKTPIVYNSDIDTLIETKSLTKVTNTPSLNYINDFRHFKKNDKHGRCC